MVKDDGQHIILITGDVEEDEAGWIVAEMPYPEEEALRLEQQKRAMMISGLPLAYKVLQDIREDALRMMEGSSGHFAHLNTFVLQAERALAYMPWLDEEKEGIDLHRAKHPIEKHGINNKLLVCSQNRINSKSS